MNQGFANYSIRREEMKALQKAFLDTSPNNQMNEHTAISL